MSEVAVAPQTVLLGPQRLRPTVGDALADLGVAGRVAVVSAGWQEREAEIGELDDHLAGVGCEVVPLALYARAERAFADDPDLAAAHRRRQDRLRALQGLYRLRLRHRLDACRELMRRDGDAASHVGDAAELLADARVDAVAAVAALDAEHLADVRQVHAAFAETECPWQRPAVVRQRDELGELLAGCAAVAVAGGHAAALLNRLRLFGLFDLAPALPVFAWSAGAMAIAERLVVFHDSPPQGAGNAEVLELGLGRVGGVLPLPHAERRLRLDDPLRVGLFARRFAPDAALTLEPGARVVFDGRETVREASGVRRLTAAGGVEPYAADDRPQPSDATDPPWPRPAPARPAAGTPRVVSRPRALRRLQGRRKLDDSVVDAFLAAHEFPLLEGNSATFVWRGEADAVRLRHWIYGLEDTLPFQRLAGTDLWTLVLEIPERSRVEYKLEIVRDGQSHLIRDPRNPRDARDPFGSNSVLQGAGYRTPRWTRPDPDARQGRIDQVTVASRAFGGERRLRVYLPARFRETRRYPLLVAHDGEDYAAYSSLVTVLDNLIERGEIAPLVVALSMPGKRLREYADDPRHARYLVDELIPQLEATYPLQATPAGRGLMGASFGAVASLSAAWRNPGFFGRLLLQSGSFAFTDIGKKHRRGKEFDPVVAFMNRFRDDPRHPADKLYVTCGIYESLIYENRSLVPLLQEAGLEVKYREARDGHNWQNWRDRLREGLSWLFPGPLWMMYE